jgi:hypothetical protein
VASATVNRKRGGSRDPTAEPVHPGEWCTRRDGPLRRPANRRLSATPRVTHLGEWRACRVLVRGLRIGGGEGRTGRRGPTSEWGRRRRHLARPAALRPASEPRWAWEVVDTDCVEEGLWRQRRSSVSQSSGRRGARLRGRLAPGEGFGFHGERWAARLTCSRAGETASGPPREHWACFGRGGLATRPSGWVRASCAVRLRPIRRRRLRSAASVSEHTIGPALRRVGRPAAPSGGDGPGTGLALGLQAGRNAASAVARTGQANELARAQGGTSATRTASGW